MYVNARRRAGRGAHTHQSPAHSSRHHEEHAQQPAPADAAAPAGTAPVPSPTHITQRKRGRPAPQTEVYDVDPLPSPQRVAEAALAGPRRAGRLAQSLHRRSRPATASAEGGDGEGDGDASSIVSVRLPPPPTHASSLRDLLTFSGVASEALAPPSSPPTPAPQPVRRLRRFTLPQPAVPLLPPSPLLLPMAALPATAPMSIDDALASPARSAAHSSSRTRGVVVPTREKRLVPRVQAVALPSKSTKAAPNPKPSLPLHAPAPALPYVTDGEREWFVIGDEYAAAERSHCEVQRVAVRDAEIAAEMDESESLEAGRFRETERLSRALGVARSLARGRSFPLESYHSLVAERIFPGDPDLPHQGALLRVKHVRGLLLHVETHPLAIEDTAKFLGEKGANGFLAQTGLFVEDPADVSGLPLPRLLPVSSSLLGYGDRLRLHRNVASLRAHLRELDRVVGQSEWPDELELEFD